MLRRRARCLQKWINSPTISGVGDNWFIIRIGRRLKGAPSLALPPWKRIFRIFRILSSSWCEMPSLQFRSSVDLDCAGESLKQPFPQRLKRFFPAIRRNREGGCRETKIIRKGEGEEIGFQTLLIYLVKPFRKLPNILLYEHCYRYKLFVALLRGEL